MEVVTVWLSQYAAVSASETASATCYRRPENIGVLAVVMSELTFGQVERQILLGYMMVVSDNATLEQTPKVLDIVGMNLASYIFARAVRNGLVLEAERGKVVVSAEFISGDQIHLVADCLADKTVERASVGVFDNLADHIALTGDSADDGSFPAQAGYMLALIPVAILVLATKARFIDFDDTHKLFEFRVSHSSPQAVTEKPRGRIGRSDLALNLLRANTLFGVEHTPENFKPSAERVVSVLENRSRDNGEPIPGLAALGALPMPRPRQFIDLLVAATRTANLACRPAALFQKPLTGIFVWEGEHQCA